MQVFQSLADNLIMLVIAIAYIWTTIAQNKVIKAKNETIKSLVTKNEEFERLSKNTLHFASETSNSVKLFKEMFSPDLLEQYTKMQITVEVNKVKDEAAKKADSDRYMIDTMNDHLNEAINYITFILYQNKYTRDQRIQFFHTYFKKGQDLFWYLTNKRIELIESKKAQIESGNSGA